MDAFKIILILRPAHSCWTINILFGLRFMFSDVHNLVRYSKTNLICSASQTGATHLRHICGGRRKKDNSDPESPLLQFHWTCFSNCRYRNQGIVQSTNCREYPIIVGSDAVVGTHCACKGKSLAACTNVGKMFTYSHTYHTYYCMYIYDMIHLNSMLRPTVHTYRYLPTQVTTII